MDRVTKGKEKQQLFIPSAFHIVELEALTCSSLRRWLIAG